MDVLEFRQYCLSLPLVEETTPFDETTLVYKVGGKMFCYTDMVDFEWIALKCEPGEAIELRERYPGLVTPAYHGNKKHWNGVNTRGELPDRFIKEQLRGSYLLVAKNITPKTLRDEVAAAIEKSGMFKASS
jgi:predicted DNA-binding protein (MmcQ/YjbR family)